jgi:hypothetical protein
MFKHISIAIPSALLLTSLSVAPTSAEQDVAATAIECGGQYECVEDRPLSLAEARASIGYPQVAQPQEPVQEPAKVATTQSPAAN